MLGIIAIGTSPIGIGERNRIKTVGVVDSAAIVAHQDEMLVFSEIADVARFLFRKQERTVET